MRVWSDRRLDSRLRVLADRPAQSRFPAQPEPARDLKRPGHPCTMRVRFLPRVPRSSLLAARPDMSRTLSLRSLLAVALGSFCCVAQAANPINEPESAGFQALGDDGRVLNLNFEKGDLTDWTATGNAW